MHIGADDVQRSLLIAELVQALLNGLGPERGIFVVPDHVVQRRCEIQGQFLFF